MMGWMVYGEIEVSAGLLRRRAARIISKRRRDATGKRKNCSKRDLHAAFGSSVVRQRRLLGLCVWLDYRQMRVAPFAHRHVEVPFEAMHKLRGVGIATEVCNLRDGAMAG